MIKGDLKVVKNNSLFVFASTSEPVSVTYLPQIPSCPMALFSNSDWIPTLIKGIKRFDQIVTTSTVRSPI